MPPRKRFRICVCRECRRNGSSDDALVGRYVGYNEYQEHQQVERAYSEETSSPSPPVIASTHMRSRPSELQEDEWESEHSQPHLEPGQSSLPAESSLASLLHDLLERVWEFASFSEPLTFQSPPSLGPHVELPPILPVEMIPNGGLLPLQLHSSNNSRFLDYQFFLLQTYRAAESVSDTAPAIPEESLLSVREDIKRLVMDELGGLEELKREQWNRHQLAVDRAREHAGTGVPFFDTCECFMNP